MLGPWPTTLVAFGAKDTALILYDNEWWRLLTPAMLHAGFIHLFVNIVIQMRLGVHLEYEWGWRPWMAVYVASAAFSSLMSCIFLPDQLGVGSSGAIMGLMGAWFVEIVCKWSTADEEAHEQLHQVSAECSNGCFTNFLMATLNIGVTLGFSFVPYVDWAAHVGGLVAGGAVGLWLFGGSLAWERGRRYAKPACAGMLLLATAAALGWLLMYGAPDPSLRDVCAMFAEYEARGVRLPAC
ncbi:unnamed protein product [Phaeothamnion confervicola]